MKKSSILPPKVDLFVVLTSVVALWAADRGWFVTAGIALVIALIRTHQIYKDYVLATLRAQFNDRHKKKVVFVPQIPVTVDNLPD